LWRPRRSRQGWPCVVVEAAIFYSAVDHPPIIEAHIIGPSGMHPLIIEAPVVSVGGRDGCEHRHGQRHRQDKY